MYNTAGDSKHLPAPDDDPQVYGTYKKLFDLRKQMPELVGGEIELDKVECSNKHVFSGLRSLTGRSALVLISFSEKAETATITLNAPVHINQGKKIMLIDMQTRKPLVLTAMDGNKFTITLKPFQGVLGRIIWRIRH